MPEMTSSDPPSDRRTSFEWSLGGLRPADAGVGRPSFMYKAGQASREKAVRLWRWTAAGLVVLLVVSGVASVGMVTAERQRAEALVAEARAHQAAALQPIVTAPHSLPVPVPVEPPDDRPPRTATPLAVATPSDDPTPTEIAAALERRRNILVGGLGLIPDRPPSPLEPGWSQPLTSGVLAVPPVKQTPTDDPPSPPEPR